VDFIFLPYLGSLLCSGYRGALLPRVKGPEREADHSVASRAEVKNGGAIPLFPTCVHGVVCN
jgi:hypothetical protein